MTNILDKIVDKTKERLSNLKSKCSVKEMEKFARNYTGEKFLFENALKEDGISFICEVKKASPSKGIISEDFPYIQTAIDYERAGASAISVLTEPYFFLGADEYLSEIAQNVKIPLLRKDFTIDEYQIYEARVIGASAVLLICSILDKSKLAEFIALADSLGMSALVEAHDEDEISKALGAGARIVGVNNRNLKTFDVDLNNSLRLRKFVPDNVLFVSESGIKTTEDIKILKENKVDAVLIGETFMRSKNKADVLKSLRGGAK